MLVSEAADSTASTTKTARRDPLNTLKVTTITTGNTR